MGFIFDTHAHYDDEQFDADRGELLAAMPEQGVGLIVDPGCDLASSRAAVELAEPLEDGARLFITIHEGRNRQVRRMCEQLGWKVTRLRRVSEGSLKLGELKTGCWRPLTEEELAGLRREIWNE